MKLVLLGIVCFGLAMEVSAINNMMTGSRPEIFKLLASIINQIQQAIITFVQRLIASLTKEKLPSINQPSNPTDYDSEDDSSTSGTSSSIGLGANEISGNKGNVEALNRFGNSASGTNGNKFNFNAKVSNNKGPVRTFTDVGNTKGGANPSTNGVGKKGLKLKEPSSNRASTPTGRVTTYTDASGRTVKNINFEGQTVSGQVGTNVGYSGIGNDYD